MKTKYVLIVLIALFAQTGYAQKNINQLFNEFSQAKDVTRVSFGNISMKLAGFFTDVMGVDGIEVLSLKECAKSVNDDFIAAFKELKDSKYETMVTSNEGNNRTRILVQMKDDVIRELVILTTGDNNALIRIKGNIKPSDIDSLVKKHGNG